MTFLSLSRSLRLPLGVLVAGGLLGVAPAVHAQSTMNDPRVGLKAGLYDAGVAARGLELVAHRNKPDSLRPNDPGGLTYANSDLAFGGHYVYQGNFSGIQIWDVANPLQPVLTDTDMCFTEQGDVSVYGHLLFVSAESPASRLDCGTGGIQDTVSKARMIGVRIFDISDPRNPKQVADVQTCRGSHTHTLVQDPKDKNDIYVYVSGLARVRSESEMAGCATGGGMSDPSSAYFRIEIIKVPLAHPDEAKIVSTARVFDSLTKAPAHGVAYADTANGGGRRGRGGRGFRLPMPKNASPADSARIENLFTQLLANRTDTALSREYSDSLKQMGVNIQLGRGGRGAAPAGMGGPNQCHDITVYPAAGLAGGACAGYGLLLNIKDPEHPVRLQAVADSNFSFWHSATFNNDATTLIFTDEWGGGTQAKCRETDPIDWGADAIFKLSNNHLTPKGYFKMPAAQTTEENCVAHNGGLVPVPGRDILVQGWYQGGISMYDFTDPAHPREIAYFDRGPIDSTRLVLGGYWCGYYYNGYIYGSEIARGFDVFKLTPTADLTQNEIDAAALVHFDQYNPQDQPKLDVAGGIPGGPGVRRPAGARQRAVDRPDRRGADGPELGRKDEGDRAQEGARHAGVVAQRRSPDHERRQAGPSVAGCGDADSVDVRRSSCVDRGAGQARHASARPFKSRRPGRRRLRALGPHRQRSRQHPDRHRIARQAAAGAVVLGPGGRIGHGFDASDGGEIEQAAPGKPDTEMLTRLQESRGRERRREEHRQPPPAGHAEPEQSAQHQNGRGERHPADGTAERDFRGTDVADSGDVRALIGVLHDPFRCRVPAPSRSSGKVLSRGGGGLPKANPLPIHPVVP